MMHDVAPNTGWQTLAELNILVGTDFESQVQAWMFEIMNIRGLDQELMNRIFKSALEALSRVENSKSNPVKIPLVHLRVYTPLEVPIKTDLRRNWGFFRIDKHGVTSTGSDHVDHLIEFFLYLEGSPPL